MKPAVSIIIPAYNAEKSIEKCIDSILNQTLKNIEIIVINDCSEDKTKELLKKYKDITIINNKRNLGPSASRNKGLKKASGKYIGFVDSDDYVNENMYKTMVSKMSKDIDLVACSRYEVIGNKKTPVINKNKTDNPKEFSKTSNFTCDKLFKKSIIDKYNLEFPENYSYAEDAYFLMKYKFYSNKMCILEEPFYYYIKDNNNSITNSYKTNLLQIIDVLEDIIIFFKEKKAFEELENELLNISMGFYTRRIKEFKKYKNTELKKEFVKKFLKLFKNNFKNYKTKLNTYKTKYYLFYRSNYYFMLIYILIK